MHKSLINQPIKKRVLDFSQCGNWLEMHEVVQKELELPDWYGKNLDALWDSVTGIMYVPADVTIIFHPVNQKAEELREGILKVIEVFEEARDKYDEITVITDIV